MTIWQGAEAWSLFWEEKRVGGTCLVSSDLVGELRKEWTHFARNLPGCGRVIDLGCGAGAVGRDLIGTRSDICVIGVDSARVPSEGEQGLTLLSSIRMEALPFDACTFDAAVSQFGIEYGNILHTAPELARVLKPGGLICFLAHHHDSKIAADGRMRHAALRALNSEQTLCAFLSGDRARLRAEFQELSRRYPHEWSVQPARAYFEHHIGGTGAQREKAAANFADLIAPDISLLFQLEESCLSPDRLGGWLVPFLSGIFEIGVSVVRSRSGQPIVWKISGQRDCRPS